MLISYHKLSENLICTSIFIVLDLKPIRRGVVYERFQMEKREGRDNMIIILKIKK